MAPDKDYTDFTIEDFIADEAFLRWVRSPDAADLLFWEDWLSRHPEQGQVVQAARDFLMKLRFAERLPAAEQVSKALSDSLQRIAVAESDRPVVVALPRRSPVWRWAVAAALTGLIALGGWLYLRQPVEMITQVAVGDSTRKVWLPDSSLVILNEGASIRYHSGWGGGKAREIWLRGEAYFDIRPAVDAAAVRPFTVHSSELKVEVLGTSFNVKEGKGFTNVSLNSGKVKVDIGASSAVALYLTPGDFLQYQLKSNKVIRKKVNAALYAVWKEDKQRLEDVPLKEMAQYIEDIFGYRVVIKDPKLSDMKISGTLRVKDEKSLLETLAFICNIQIKRQDSVLLFQSKSIAKPN